MYLQYIKLDYYQHINALHSLRHTKNTDVTDSGKTDIPTLCCHGNGRLDNGGTTTTTITC